MTSHETADLLPKLLQEPDFNLEIALHWGEFAAVSALMEHRGIPLDREIVPQLQDKRAWAFVRDAVVPRIDAQYGVYIQDKAGDWHFSIERFEALCARLGIDWPRLESGKLNLRRKTFESMCKAYPELESLRQLRHARDKMRRIKLAVGQRRPKSHGVVGVRLEDIPHTTEGIAVGILAGGVAALADQARSLGARSPMSIGPRWNSKSRLCSRSASRCWSSTPPAAHTSNSRSALTRRRQRQPSRQTPRHTRPTRPFCSAPSTVCST